MLAEVVVVTEFVVVVTAPWLLTATDGTNGGTTDGTGGFPQVSFGESKTFA